METHQNSRRRPRQDRQVDLIGWLACATVALFPFFLDERLNRLKLLSLETGVAALAAAVGARWIIRGGWPAPAEMKRRFVAHLPPVAVLAWFALNLFLCLAAKDPALAISELRRVTLATASFLAFYFAGFDRTWRFRLLVAWSLAAAGVAIYGILQRNGGVGIIAVPEMRRVISTFGNPIFLAAHLVLSLFVSIGAARVAARGAPRFALWFCATLIAAALVLTETRAAYVALAVALAAALIFSRAARPSWTVLALVGIAAVAALTWRLWGRDQAHLLIWRDTLRMALDHPYIGVGLGAFHVHFPAAAQADLIAKWPPKAFVVNFAHNEYLQALAEGGPILLLSFLSIFAAFFINMRIRHLKWDAPPDLAALSLGVLAVAVQNFFSVDMRFGISLASAFIVMAVALGDREVDAPVSNAAPAGPGAARIVLAALWVGLAGFVVVRGLWAPHLAQRQVVSAPGFFDQRLLEPAKTIGDLELLARQYPNEADVLEKLAYAYAKEMQSADGKLDPAMAEKAVAGYRRVIEADPGRVSAHNNLGNVTFTMGRTEEALSHWRRAVELDPAFIDARLNIGKVLYVQGRLKDAAAQFQEVLKLQPGHPEAALYLRRMVE